MDQRLGDQNAVFFQKPVSFLGHIISESGVEVDPEKEKAVERMKELSSLKDVRAFLGLVGYYRKFIPGFNSKTSLHFTESVKKIWMEYRVQSAVTKLKKKFFEALVLEYPENRDPYTVTTDLCW